MGTVHLEYEHSIFKNMAHSNRKKNHRDWSETELVVVIIFQSFIEIIFQNEYE
jgi:hypothetical protein